MTKDTVKAADQCPKLSGTRHGEEVVGICCKVFWADDKKWYKGVISQHDASKAKHLIEYEDGDTEWLDLAKEKIELLQKPLGPPGIDTIIMCTTWINYNT